MARARLDGEERRRSIVESAVPLFARRGFAGTTTKEIARQAGVSEALLFQHFPSKAALYREILAQGCEGDPALAKLMSLEPSTAALVEVTHMFVRHFVGSASEDCEIRQRLMLNSFLEDGEYARLVYGWVQDEIYPWFAACIAAARQAGDLASGSVLPANAFWLGEHVAAFVAFARLGGHATVPYGGDLETVIADATRFILRGYGLSDALIDRNWPAAPADRAAAA
ncbi:MAG TPA: helix-turn-helix domain-containing protein [Geminicoccaceae bacterium]|mgnify:CR=1 FL=1|nr:helix-turn-helix domain-containing protein [Geminicoccus sp.]HMU48424.1 helix-turn-helix domain-containing protein [Geminicoccaceae bacterium]